MDENFQLKRLKCAGNDIGEPLIKERYIMKQEYYDQWVNSQGSFKYKHNIQVSSNLLNFT